MKFLERPISCTLLQRPANPATYPLGYLPSLDGARGLMTLGVLVAHTRMALFPGAIIYMDVFFAMSGYLITSLLVAEHQKHGSISLKRFYVRRLRRLYPALAVMLTTLLVVCYLFSADLRLRVTEIAVTFFYLMDYWRPLVGTGVYYTGHTWSLAVEEQFYLLWPLAFIGLWRWSGRSWKTAFIILAAASGFTVLRISRAWAGASIFELYDCFHMRADSLLAGCGLAVILKMVDFRSYPRLSAALADSLLPLAVVGVVLGFVVDSHMRWYYYVSPLLGAIPGTIVVAGLVQPRRTIMHGVLEYPFFVFCGRICYGLYVWHYPIFTYIADTLKPRYGMVLLIGWPLAFAAATLSYYLVERHFMRARPL